MEILNYILIILQITFYFICCFMGGWLAADIITKEKEKRKIESSTIKTNELIIELPKRYMFVEIVFDTDEYQFFDGIDGDHYTFYLPGTNLKEGDFVAFTFTPGHIYYEIQ